MVSLARFGDESSARIAGALLDSAGIPNRLHGESLGPYRLTIGEMAITEIWVAAEDVEDAAEVLTGAEIDHVLDPIVRGEPPAPVNDFALRIVALVTAGVLLLAVIRALMRVF